MASLAESWDLWRHEALHRRWTMACFDPVEDVLLVKVRQGEAWGFGQEFLADPYESARKVLGVALMGELLRGRPREEILAMSDDEIAEMARPIVRGMP